VRRNQHAKSKTLESYSLFIEKVNEFKKKFTLDESLKNAVKYCIENDILKQFLREHGSEVINMLTDDITIEEIVAIRSEEAREEGREEGKAEIIALLKKGLSPEEIINEK